MFTQLNELYQTDQTEENAKLFLQALERIKEEDEKPYTIPTIKITIENIVFLSVDDYTQMCCELDQDYDPEGYTSAWLDDDDIIKYMFQWYYPGEHAQGDFLAVEINTNFLGYTRIIDGQVFLYTHNESLGYACLSRIIRIVE